jgi:S1-C subfamily serine protease
MTQEKSMRRSALRPVLGATALALGLAGCGASSPSSPAAAAASPAAPSVSPAAPDGSPAGPGGPSAAPGGPAAADAASLQQAYVSVVAKALPSVVQITTADGLGSGVVFDNKGDIVTNAHVVGTASSFQVRLAGRPAPVEASLVGAYAPDDLAVIKLDHPPAGLVPVQFADSTKLAIGDIVLALGNPLGFTGSVTEGIVSALGRTVTEPPESGRPGATLPNVIQTSAAINPGNSGGALVDLDGKVVGVTTLAAVDPQIGGGSAAPGIGFAIPASIVSDIAGQLATDGKVTDSHRAALGVGVVTVIGSDGLPLGAGVATVEAGGPARAAGITVGSIITKLDDKTVSSAQDLSTVLAGLHPGEQVPVTFADPQGKIRTVTVTLGKLPGS